MPNGAGRTTSRPSTATDPTAAPQVESAVAGAGLRLTDMSVPAVKAGVRAVVAGEIASVLSAGAGAGPPVSALESPHPPRSFRPWRIHAAGRGR